MKHRLLLFGSLVMVIVVLAGCKTVYNSDISSRPNLSYLYFVSASKYQGGVEVCVDNETRFKAEVVKDRKSAIKNNTYEVTTGKRNIVVIYNGNVIYEQDVFLATLKAKKIVLP